MKTLRLNWFLPVLLLFSVITFSAFTIVGNNEKVRGSGNIKEEARSEGPFRSIRTSGSYNVYITQGTKHDIRIEADDNLLPLIITKVSGNDLEIYTKKGYDIKPSKTINVYVTLDQLEELSSSGSGGFYSKSKLNGGNVKFSFSGSTNTELDLNANDLRVEVSGSSHLNLKGSIPATRYDISGSADVEALDLQSDNANISISGSGKLDVAVAKKLDLSVSGMGKVRYKGSPDGD